MRDYFDVMDLFQKMLKKKTTVFINSVISSVLLCKEYVMQDANINNIFKQFLYFKKQKQN